MLPDSGQHTHTDIVGAEPLDVETAEVTIVVLCVVVDTHVVVSDDLDTGGTDGGAGVLTDVGGFTSEAGVIGGSQPIGVDFTGVAGGGVVHVQTSGPHEQIAMFWRGDIGNFSFLLFSFSKSETLIARSKSRQGTPRY